MKNLRTKLFVIILGGFFLSGCAGIQLTEDRITSRESKVVEEYSYSFIVPYLYYSTTPVDIESYCKLGQLQSVYVRKNVLGFLGSVLSAGFVSPQKVSTSCQL